MNKTEGGTRNVITLISIFIALCSLVFGPNIYQQLTGRSIYQTFSRYLGPTPTATKAITVEFLGQQQFRVLEATNLSPATCSDPHDFLDVYTFSIINNDPDRQISLYRLDTKFKIGNIGPTNEDLKSAPEYLISFPVSKSNFFPISEHSQFDKPKVFAYLNGYIYKQDTLPSPCTPESTADLSMTFNPESTTTLKIGILFDYTDTREDDAHPAEIWIGPVSYILKETSFVYSFSNNNVITIDVP